MSGILSGLVVVVAIALALWSLRNVKFLQYLFFLRFQIGLAAFLVGFPLLALTVARNLLRNLFIVEHWSELAAVSGLAVIVAWVVMVASLITLRWGKERFDLPELKDPAWLRFKVPLFGCLAIPIIGTATALSWDPIAAGGWWLVPGAVVLGIAGALASLVVAVNLQYLALKPDSGPQKDFLLNPDRWVWARLRRADLGIEEACAVPQRIRPALGPAYLDPEGRLLCGHGLAIGFLTVSVLLYWAGYFLLAPPRPFLPMAALGYVLILVAALGWLLTGVAFYLDHWRVPVVIGVVAYALVVYSLNDTDHYFDLVASGKESARALSPLRPEEVMGTWLATSPPSERPVMVVVAAAGGGIQAAAWTAHVLTGLASDEHGGGIGPDFGRAIRLISSVSGGSVGAMYFVNGYSAQGPPSPQRLAEIPARAGTSSLSAVAWGLVYPDLQRIFWPFPGISATVDRAAMMEQSWQSGLLSSPEQAPAPTLAQWATGVREGWRPATVFNATIVDTGKRLLLSTADIPGTHGAEHFAKLYGGHDISVVTAARLSATFPYVTPVARALPSGNAHDVSYYIADGGYYDNFGVATALDWLREVIRLEYGPKLRGILLLEIRLEPEESTASEQVRSQRESHGWVYATLGPALAITKVRTATQRARNDVEIDQFRRSLAGQKVCMDSFVLTPGAPGPLSWHLTAREQGDLAKAWHENAKVRATVAEMRDWFHSSDPCRGAAAGRLGKRP